MNKKIKQHKRPGHKKGRAFFLCCQDCQHSIMEPAKVVRWYEGSQDCQHSIMEPAKVGRWYEGRQDCQHSIMEPAKIHHTRPRAIYYIMYICYTRYRKLEILGVLEAVGPLFLCVIDVMGVYRITEKSGQPGGLYYIYKVSG